MLNFIPRPSQEQILRYRGGRLGIAAVPGAGKTQILSTLAAQVIASGSLGNDQEVLIVTSSTRQWTISKRASNDSL